MRWSIDKHCPIRCLHHLKFKCPLLHVVPLHRGTISPYRHRNQSQNSRLCQLPSSWDGELGWVSHNGNLHGKKFPMLGRMPLEWAIQFHRYNERSTDSRLQPDNCRKPGEIRIIGVHSCVGHLRQQSNHHLGHRLSSSQLPWVRRTIDWAEGDDWDERAWLDYNHWFLAFPSWIRLHKRSRKVPPLLHGSKQIKLRNDTQKDR